MGRVQEEREEPDNMTLSCRSKVLLLCCTQIYKCSEVVELYFLRANSWKSNIRTLKAVIVIIMYKDNR